MDPKELSSYLNEIADKVDASKQPSRKLVAAALCDVIAAVERNKDRAKKKGKINKKDVDASTAASMHMSLLEKYKNFHDTGTNLMGFKNVVEGIPENSPNDVVAAQKECAKAFNELDAALRNARNAYSHLMASLALVA
jgi:hypothetical protein